MNYFRFFPTVKYNLDSTTESKRTAVNMLARFKLNSLIADKKGVVFYPYTVKESDRPDIVAHNYYGHVRYTWIVWLSNMVNDPSFEWPMNHTQFVDYLDQTYGSVAAAQALSVRLENDKGLEIDLDTYNALPAVNRREIFAYDDELDKNEKRRKIKLLDSALTNKLQRDIIKVFL